MSTGVCTVYGIERKLGSQNAPGSGTTDSGPSKQHSASGGHDQQQDRTELVIGHHKLRAWKDVDSSLPSARRACTYPETPTARSTSSQVLSAFFYFLGNVCSSYATGYGLFQVISRLSQFIRCLVTSDLWKNVTELVSSVKAITSTHAGSQ